MPPQQRRDEEHLEVNASLRAPLLSSSLGDYSATHEDYSVASLSSSAPPSRRRKLLSRNVPLTMTHTVFYFAGSSIWSSNVLSAYIYMLVKGEHDSDIDPQQAVGYITGVMGLAQLLCSFPAGRFADSYRRDTLLRLASVLGILAIGATLFAVLWTQDYRHLAVALTIWGCTLGIGNTALWALFADSVPTGDRSQYFTKRAILTTLGTVAGPVTCLIMFYLLGSGGDQQEWEVRTCAIVLAVGQIVSLPAILLFSFFNDDYAAAVHDDTDYDGEDLQGVVTEVDQPSLLDIAHDEELADAQDEIRYELSSLANDEYESGGNDESESVAPSRLEWWWSRCDHFLQKRRIPCLVAAADLLSGLATGMSVRYFPIFFVHSLKLGPVLVQLIYVTTPLLQATMAQVGQLMSKRLGRLHVAVVHKWIGVIFMYAMIVAHEMQAPLELVIFLFICRTAIINSVGSLTRSTLMDHVPKAERGQWSALESVNVSGWSGSAVLGGLLVSQIGLTHLFFLTASLQIVATFPLIALFRDDELEQSTIGATNERATSAALQSGGSVDMTTGSESTRQEEDSWTAATMITHEVSTRPQRPSSVE